MVNCEHHHHHQADEKKPKETRGTKSARWKLGGKGFAANFNQRECKAKTVRLETWEHGPGDECFCSKTEGEDDDSDAVEDEDYDVPSVALLV